MSLLAIIKWLRLFNVFARRWYHNNAVVDALLSQWEIQLNFYLWSVKTAAVPRVQQ